MPGSECSRDATRKSRSDAHLERADGTDGLSNAVERLSGCGRFGRSTRGENSREELRRRLLRERASSGWRSCARCAPERPAESSRQAYLTVQPYARVMGVFTGCPAATAWSASRT